MAEQKGISFTSIIIGVAIGAIVVYWILKNKNPNMTLSPDTNSNYSNSIGLSALNQRMNLMEQKLSQIQPTQLTQIPAQIATASPISPVSISAVSTPVPTAPTLATYNNKEITEYIKDKDGDIIRKVVTRNANINDKRQ